MNQGQTEEAEIQFGGINKPAKKEEIVSEKRRLRLFIPGIKSGDDYDLVCQLTSALSEVDTFGGTWTYPAEGVMTCPYGESTGRRGIVIELFVEGIEEDIPQP